MNVTESLRAQLVALNTAAGAEVHFMQLPQDENGTITDPRSLTPTLTFQQISDAPDVVLLSDGKSGSHRPRFQVTAWAPDPSDAIALSQQVKDGLIGFLGMLGGFGGVNVLNLALAGGGQMIDPITRLYKIHADFLITYSV